MLHWQDVSPGFISVTTVDHTQKASFSSLRRCHFYCILKYIIVAMATCYLGRIRLGYSGIRIYSGLYSGYSAPRGRIAGMGIQLFRNENSPQTNAYSHYSSYSYSGLIPNERTLAFIAFVLFSNSHELSQSVAFFPVVLPANEKAKNMYP